MSDHCTGTLFLYGRDLLKSQCSSQCLFEHLDDSLHCPKTAFKVLASELLLDVIVGLIVVDSLGNVVGLFSLVYSRTHKYYGFALR